MREAIKYLYPISMACILPVINPLFAAEPNPQSYAAIQQTAEGLEASQEAKSNEKENNEHDELILADDTSSDSVTKENVEKLKQQCDEAREQHIAPLRKSAIEECISKKELKSPAECKRFYQDFGEAGRTQQGYFRQRRFHNIPECQPYYEAEKKLRMNTK